VDARDADLTNEAAAWLEQLQASDRKTAALADDAIYALSCPGPASGRPWPMRSPARRSRT
jgi:hypothetical protein